MLISKHQLICPETFVASVRQASSQGPAKRLTLLFSLSQSSQKRQSSRPRPKFPLPLGSSLALPSAKRSVMGGGFGGHIQGLESFSETTRGC